MQPTVEILLAAYNGERFLREQLDSLLAQTWGAWHLTVSDDGSSDGTPAILDGYAAQYPDRIRRVRHEGRFGNARDHFFWLMKECEASYMMFCDQDDVWHPDKVEKTMRALLAAEAEAGADVPLLVFTDLTPTDEKLRPIASSLMKMQKQNPTATDYRNILFQNIVTGCTSALNRPLARLAEQCTTPKETIMHDWWLALVAGRFGRMVYIGDSTMFYRQHRENSVGAQAVDTLPYIFYKLSHMTVFQKSIEDKKRQAATFLKTYTDALSAEEKRFLEAFSARRSPLNFKLSYLKWITTLLRKGGFLARW